MTDTKADLRRRKLKTPRAAAVAGILFTLLYGASMLLIRLSIPADLGADNAFWLQINSRRIVLALNMVPFAGIAFLWFIGVLRDRLGEYEDRLFRDGVFGQRLDVFGDDLCRRSIGRGAAEQLRGRARRFGRKWRIQITAVPSCIRLSMFMLFGWPACS